MNISVDFGSAPGGTVGYQFFDATGLLGSRVTTGISNPRVGIYYKASVTPDAGAIGVYWDDGTINATEVFETNPQPADVYSFQSSAITSGAFASGAIHATAIDTGAIRADVFAADAIDGNAVAADALSAITAWTVNITGSLSGAVGSVTGSVGSVTGAVGSANAVETGISIAQALSALVAWATGKAENGNTSAIDFYAPNGTTKRIAMAGVDVDGNRTGSTLTL